MTKAIKTNCSRCKKIRIITDHKRGLCQSCRVNFWIRLKKEKIRLKKEKEK